MQAGAGACDVIDHWHDGETYAIDPLAERYKERFRQFQDPAVEYIEGSAEHLPYESDFFDVVIMCNALDHFEDPYRALCGTFRVLKPGGALYVWIYLYSWPASVSHRAFNALRKRFICEPWAFTFRQIKKCLAVSGFLPTLPAIEERPCPFHQPGDLPLASHLKHAAEGIVRKALGLLINKGLTCVALPRKGTWSGCRLPD